MKDEEHCLEECSGCAANLHELVSAAWFISAPELNPGENW